MYPNPQDVLPLPPRPNIAQFDELAKDLVKACQSGVPDAFREWAAGWPDQAQQIEPFARDTLATGMPSRASCAPARPSILNGSRTIQIAGRSPRRCARTRG